MTLATSKNLTILGILTILQAVAQALTAVFDGKPETAVDLNILFTQIMLGVGMIMAKGAASTGGTIPETTEAVARTQPVVPPGP